MTRTLGARVGIERPRRELARRALRPVEPVQSTPISAHVPPASGGFSLASTPIEAPAALRLISGEPMSPALGGAAPAGASPRLAPAAVIVPAPVVEATPALAVAPDVAPASATLARSVLPAAAPDVADTAAPSAAQPSALEAPPPTLAAAAAEPALPVPDRTAQEMALGRSLGHVALHAGPTTRQALDTLGADGAAAGADVFVRELPSHGSTANQESARDVLAHEIVHAARPSPAPAQASAESAAEPAGLALAAATAEFHRPVGEGPPPAPLDRSVVERAAPGASAVALRRSATTLPPEPMAATVVGDPSAAFSDRRARPPLDDGARRASSVEESGSDAETATSASVGVSAETASAAPSSALESGASAVGASSAGVEVPGTAPLVAEGVAGVAAAFVAAPPSQKAWAADGLESQLSEQAQTAASADAETLPSLAANMGGAAEMAPVSGDALQPQVIAAPDLVLDAAPAPAAEEVVPSAPESEEFTANDGLFSWFRGLFGDSPAANASSIGDAINNVETVDSSVPTSPGPVPAVPFEGASDPALIGREHAEGVGQAEEGQAAARAAVVEGPGAEAVQPLALDEQTEIRAVVQSPLEAQPPVDGIEQFKQAAMPEDVQAAFDAQNAAPMQASLASAEQQVGDAVATRDTDWQAEVETATADNQALLDTAEQGQTAAVETQRERIQTERQSTLEEQDVAVAEVRLEAGTLEQDQQGEIDDRVERDQAEIGRRYGEAEQQAAAEVEAGERRAEAEKEAAERDAEDESWWDQATSFISDAVSALVDAVNSIIDGVREAVGALIDAVRDAAVGLIELATEFVQAAIAFYGELLTSLVNGLLGELFPELAAALTGFINAAVNLAQQAVRAVADTLIAGVNALAEAAHAGLNAVLDAFQGALRFASSLIRAALSGDWSEVLRLLLEAALAVAGIEPAAFYAFVGQLQDTFSIIVNDPLGFLGNLFGAVSLGFEIFVNDIVDHLQQGFFEWVVGPLGELGITLPDTWDIWSILGIVMQVLGLTQDGIRGVMVEELGETAGTIFDFVWRYVEALITGGWQGLWEQIQNDLSSLWSMVVDGIKNWLVTTIITQGTLKLLSLIDPSGISQIVQVVLTCWQIYTFLRDNLQRIWGVVSSVVNTISEIANGVLQRAAEMVDAALASLIPIAISLLANLLGLGGITARVREIIEDIRETVRNAIRNLIRRVRGLFGGGGEGEEDAPADATEDAGAWWSVEEEFPDEENESHTIRVAGSENEPTILVESTPQSLQALIGQVDEDAHPGVRNRLTEDLRQINTRIQQNAERELTEDERATQREAVRADIATITTALREAEVLGNGPVTPTAVTWSTNGSRASHVSGAPLTSMAGNTSGNSATSAALGYEDYVVRLFRQTDSDERTMADGTQRQINQVAEVHRTHLLSGGGAHNLHGPNEIWNLVCAHTSANRQMDTGPEQLVCDAITHADNPQQATYSVAVTYHESSLVDAEVQQLKADLAADGVSPDREIAKKVVGYYFAARLDVTYQIGEAAAQNVSINSPLDDSFFRDGPPPKTVDQLIQDYVADNPSAVGDRGQVSRDDIGRGIHRDNDDVQAAFQRLVGSFLVTEASGRGNSYFVSSRYQRPETTLNPVLASVPVGTVLTQRMLVPLLGMDWRTIVALLEAHPDVEKSGRSYVRAR